MNRAALLGLALVACKTRAAVDKGGPGPQPELAQPADAGRPIDGPATAWPELADLPPVEPLRIVHLPTQAKLPRFEVAGPVIAGDVAIVASSQFGFDAVDWHTGALAWTKPAGSRVAPPIVVGNHALLIGECPTAIDVPAGHDLLGCLRTVTFAGVDQAYIAVHGVVPEFASEPGPQQMWLDPAGVRWRRGERAVTIDPMSGLAKPAPIDPPKLHVTYGKRAWDVVRTDDAIVATGKPSWSTRHPYSVLIGGVYLPDQSPMVRVLRVGMFGPVSEVDVLDIDATGSLHGQAAFPVPGIDVLAHAESSIGDTALAVRLDKSLTRDYVAGYAANALLMWVYPLPIEPRIDPVGIAIAPEAVVVFHDGDTVTILPELSAPPTAPGAARAPSQITTP